MYYLLENSSSLIYRKEYKRIEIKILSKILVLDILHMERQEVEMLQEIVNLYMDSMDHNALPACSK